LKYQDYYKNRTERLKRPKRRKKDRCGEAKKKIEDKFLQIYLNKDLLTGEEVISNFSDADVESLRNGYLGEESQNEWLCQINASVLEDAQKLHKQNPSNLREINELLTQYVIQNFKARIPENLQEQSSKWRSSTSQSLKIVKRTVKSVLAAVSLLLPQLNRFLKSSLEEGEKQMEHVYANILEQAKQTFHFKAPDT